MSLLRVRHRELEVAEGRLRTSQEAFARRRERDAPGGSGEQLNTDTVLQKGDRPAEGGGRQSDLCRRCAKVPDPSQHHSRLDLDQATTWDYFVFRHDLLHIIRLIATQARS